MNSPGVNCLAIVIIFEKKNHLRASTEIHFLPVPESYIQALFQKHQALDNRLPGLL